MKNILPFSCLLLTVFFTFSSCRKHEHKHDHDHEHEHEVITTLKYVLTDSTGHTVTMSFKDLDGDGGNAPVITEDTLAANTTYTAVLTLLNESESPAEDITQEVRTEGLEHQFFFASTLSDLTVAYDDADSNNNPIGLSTSVTTGGAGTGKLTITLLHEPDKNASAVSDGDRSNAGGETDIEVSFDIVVQ